MQFINLSRQFWSPKEMVPPDQPKITEELVHACVISLIWSPLLGQQSFSSCHISKDGMQPSHSTTDIMLKDDKDDKRELVEQVYAYLATRRAETRTISALPGKRMESYTTKLRRMERYAI